MIKPDTPIRLLAKTYANDLITREHYHEVLAQLLKKLEQNEKIELKDFYDQIKNTAAFQSDDQAGPETRNGYSKTDWIIFTLGIIASAVLGYILYI